jgi:hypothetical protein
VYPDWGWGVATVGPPSSRRLDPAPTTARTAPRRWKPTAPGRYRAHLPALSDPADRFQYEPAPQPADHPSHDKSRKIEADDLVHGAARRGGVGRPPAVMGPVSADLETTGPDRPRGRRSARALSQAGADRRVRMAVWGTRSPPTGHGVHHGRGLVPHSGEVGHAVVPGSSPVLSASSGAARPTTHPEAR